jgi:hypothetical protein
MGPAGIFNSSVKWAGRLIDRTFSGLIYRPMIFKWRTDISPANQTEHET